MESITEQPPLVVIVGQTASGKSALALDLAERFNGEIIAADARSIYKGMDIGTAKPTKKQRQLIVHHLIDIAEPGDIFTVADFKRLAQTEILAVSKRGKLPILVGGSGLYIYSVVYDFAFRKPNPEERQKLVGLSVEELQSLISERGLPMPVNSKNHRHLISAIETGQIIKGQNKLRPNTLMIGLDVEGNDLVRNIKHRTEKMIRSGLETEVRGLAHKYGWGTEALNQTIGYEEFRPYFDGRISIDDVVRQIELHTKRLSKRQKTWFKRNSDIHWISKSDEAVDLVTTFLNK